MYYITEMHVMPITFQLLLYYNKFLRVGFFKSLLQDYQTKITIKLHISRVKHILLKSVLNNTNICCKIAQDEMLYVWTLCQ